MEKAHDAFSELTPLAQELRNAMPPPEPGFHLREFEGGRVRLLLLIGDAADVFSKLNASVDAWYLDGFAPAKNPSMWTDGLFIQMARLSNSNATLATFTSAGFVRRGLSAQGFDMRKTAGFGRKRERLVGTFVGSNNSAVQPSNTPTLPVWAKAPPLEKPKSVAIIGGGVAGASAAYALKRRGVDVAVISSTTRHKASSLPAAILAPRFLLDAAPERCFFAAAYAFAIHHPAFKEAFSEDTGVVYPFVDETAKKRLHAVAESYNWPDDWMSLQEGGLILPKGGTIDAQLVINTLLDGVQVKERDLSSLSYKQGKWHLLDAEGQDFMATDSVILAAGTSTVEILERSNLHHSNHNNDYPEIRTVEGQIELVRGGTEQGLPASTMSYGGYVSASLAGKGDLDYRTVGSTFDPVLTGPLTEPAVSPDAKNRILMAFEDATGISADTLDHIGSWAGLRGTVADHLPYAGPVPIWDDLVEICKPLAKDAKADLERAPRYYPGLFCLAGMGSKGFQYGPILGEYVASLLTGAPSPLPMNMVSKLHPARGLVRDIIRKKYTPKKTPSQADGS